MSLIGFIAGDIAGSAHEYPESVRIKTKQFILFPKEARYTDDTVMTLAIAKALLGTEYFENGRWDFQELTPDQVVRFLVEYGKHYPNAGYGGKFKDWINNPKPYGSWGNGAAMRVGAVGLAFNDLDTIMRVAKTTAEVSHNCEEAIVSAQAVAVATRLAADHIPLMEIRDRLEETFRYEFRRPDEIREDYGFEVRASKSVPEAISCFLYSESAEDAIRNAVSLGGDSDTQASIAGGLAVCFYKKIPKKMREVVYSEYLPPRLLEILDGFDSSINAHYSVC